MRAFILDFLDRMARASVFANAGNLGEALSLMEQGRQDERVRRRLRAARAAARRLMPRPRRASRPRPLVVEPSWR